MQLEIALVYLSDRRVAYSSIAFHMLKAYLEENRVRTATYFLEDGELVAERPSPHPRKARIVVTSLPYELLYTELIKALDNAGIPVWRNERTGEHPVILAGGPSVTANPAPLTPILDAVLVGEAEPVLDDIIDASQAETRRRALERLASTPGLLIPGLKERVKRIYVKDLDKAWYPVNQRVPPGVEPVWGRSFMLETTRGCSRMCRFCMEGAIFRPKRDRGYATLRNLLEAGLEETRAGKVSFYSLAFFDNPDAEGILAHAVALGLEVSVPSIRAETLTVDRARLIAEGGQRTITIAPETGSCRIGEAINKCIGLEGTMNAIDTVLEAGLNNVKLYLITGFPGELDNEFIETIRLAEEAAIRVARGGGTLKVSINPFIPKPVTPLQWAPAPDPKIAARRIQLLRKSVSRKGGRVTWYDPKWIIPQTVFSRGDSRISQLIIEWARRGARLGQFKGVARESRLNLEYYLAEKPVEWDPPWHELVEHPYASLRSLRFEYKSFLSVIASGRHR
ncbi:MAG: radical SAM protein [Desulfurococcales archaeon]|nr:radical SAM protein [Desulfurococcales archaeon]